MMPSAIASFTDAARGCSYHNAAHAADVVATTSYFLRQPNLQKHLSPLDALAALVAALVHDVGHRGINNNLLQRMRDHLAITYNDVSVLENHHVATSFKLLSVKGCDWTHCLTEEQFRDFRETVISIVLGTDMKTHFDHLTKFKSKMAGENFGVEQLDRKDMRLMLLLSVHAADNCNPAKPLEMALEWAWRIMEEFFRQGDMEVRLSFPVSPFMDRRKDSPARTIVNCQVGFINVLVKPFFQEWVQFLADAPERQQLEREIISTLNANTRIFETSAVKMFESCIGYSTLATTHTADLLAGWMNRRVLFLSEAKAEATSVAIGSV